MQLAEHSLERSFFRTVGNQGDDGPSTTRDLKVGTLGNLAQVVRYFVQLRAFGKNEIVMGSRTSNKLTSNLNGGMPPESPRGDRADAVTAQSHAT
ncbi:MAG TPA: hypothetical protein VH643_09865, partial [Gemmataceae bacterium]